MLTTISDLETGNGTAQIIGRRRTPNGPAAPAGCLSPGATTMSRYDTYLHEVTTSIIPDTTGDAPPGDNGNPVCYNGGPVPPTPTLPADRINDRRMFTVAVLNCVQHGVAGNSSNVPVEYYLSAFMTESVASPPDDDLYLEIVGSSASGGNGAVPIRLNEWVELVR